MCLHTHTYNREPGTSRSSALQSRGGSALSSSRGAKKGEKVRGKGRTDTRSSTLTLMNADYVAHCQQFRVNRRLSSLRSCSFLLFVSFPISSPIIEFLEILNDLLAPRSAESADRNALLSFLFLCALFYCVRLAPHQLLLPLLLEKCVPSASSLWPQHRWCSACPCTTTTT